MLQDSILQGKQVLRTIARYKKVQKIHGLPATQQIIQLLHGADIKDRKPMINIEGERYVPQDLFRK